MQGRNAKSETRCNTARMFPGGFLHHGVTNCTETQCSNIVKQLCPGFHLQGPRTHSPLLVHPVGTSLTHSSTHSRQLQLQTDGSNVGRVQFAPFLLDCQLDRKLIIVGFWVVSCHLKIFYYLLIGDKITRKNICDPWCGCYLQLPPCEDAIVTQLQRWHEIPGFCHILLLFIVKMTMYMIHSGE